MRARPDPDIAAYADADGRVVVTKDADVIAFAASVFVELHRDVLVVHGPADVLTRGTTVTVAVVLVGLEARPRTR